VAAARVFKTCSSAIDKCLISVTVAVVSAAVVSDGVPFNIGGPPGIALLAAVAAVVEPVGVTGADGAAATAARTGADVDCADNPALDGRDGVRRGLDPDNVVVAVTVVTVVAPLLLAIVPADDVDGVMVGAGDTDADGAVVLVVVAAVDDEVLVPLAGHAAITVGAAGDTGATPATGRIFGDGVLLVVDAAICGGADDFSLVALPDDAVVGLGDVAPLAAADDLAVANDLSALRVPSGDRSAILASPLP
jgi:hypothetical protein